MRRSRIKFALFFVAVAILAAFLWRPVRQAHAIAALRSTVQGRHFSLLVDVDKVGPTENFFMDWLDRRLIEERWYVEHRLIFEGFFGDPFDSVWLTHVEGFQRDPGPLISRFSGMLEFRAFESEQGRVPEASWKQLFTGVARVDSLEFFDVHACYFTDDVMATLSHHPRIDTAIIDGSLITPKGILVLATMPRLVRVCLSNPRHDLGNATGTRPATDVEWELLCQNLRKLPTLRFLDISGAVTDSAIAPLSGHPEIRSLTIASDRPLTAASARTFASLPQLQSLTLDLNSPSKEKASYPDQTRHALEAALPTLEIDIQ